MHTHFLQTLSPTAAKVYLILSTLARADADPPVAQVHLRRLAEFANLAPRTCSLALRQLIALQLITRLPRRKRAPTSYHLTPLHYAHQDAPQQPYAHSAAPNLAPSAHPHAPNIPPDAQPHAPNPSLTPISTPKSHNAHPDAPNSTLTLTPTERALLADPHIQKILLAALLPSKETAHVGNNSNI